VGFRPFVYRLARARGLSGGVYNCSQGVVLEAQGEPAALEEFGRRLRGEAPPLARVEAVRQRALPPTRGGGVDSCCFEIRESLDTPGTATALPADVATCADCLRELRDPSDRRYRYPFTNCTNCGPRWSIIDRIPYDRPYTSMAHFRMCERCRAEYEDPGDRRFHAQPNACPECGPRVWLAEAGAPLEAGVLEGDVAPPGADSEKALARGASLLAAGRIVAIKGLGGFHLAVRADDERAVARLRRRKGRAAKPLALMVANLVAARRLAAVDGAAEERLAAPEAPILLLPRRATGPMRAAKQGRPAPAAGATAQGGRLAAAVAPGQRRIGVMLPYTPLHHVLFDQLAEHAVTALVMTSGNRGEEPICLSNGEVRQQLRAIADAWLLHDRPILRRADDSVLWLDEEGRSRFLRRSRGYAPRPILLRGGAARGPAVLAVGAELKSVLCLLKGERAFLSPHVGDLENLPTHRLFRETAEALQRLFECRPQWIAHDLHPRYLSTLWAREQQGGQPMAVQHHHAHMAAVMAEYGLAGPVVGLILDGTGLGEDGALWGGEVLAGDAVAYRRLGHLQAVPLPGGEAAIRQPWRMALSYLRDAYGAQLPPLPWLQQRPVAAILELLERGLNAPACSSAGRLFDAVAALTGRWLEARYEAQPAVELMALTTLEDVRRAEPFPWEIGAPARGAAEAWVMPSAPLVRAVVEALLAGSDAATISARFHRTLADLLVAAAGRAADEAGTRVVVLGGGVWQNELLLVEVLRGLRAAGLRPYAPTRVPAGDGGIALGQALVARSRIGGPATGGEQG
jgi:hydrogenase maturation protein HypF